MTLISYIVGPADLREHEDVVSGRAGVIDYGTEYGKRPIDMVLLLEQSPTRSIRALVHDLIAMFKPTLPAAPLIFDAEPHRTYWAKYTGKLGIEELAYFGQFTLSLKCADPFAYGPEQITEATMTGSPSTLSVVSGGTEETAPLIRIVNSGSNTIHGFTIKNSVLVD